MMKLEELVRYLSDLGQGGQPHFIQINKDMRECSEQQQKKFHIAGTRSGRNSGPCQGFLKGNDRIIWT